MSIENVEKKIWSYSRITSFAQCKYQFYLKYIVCNESDYLPEGNYYAEVGSYVHHILEMIMEKKLDIDEASQYFVEHFDDYVFYKTKQSIMDKIFEACANYFADLSLDWLKDYDIVGVEKEIDVTIDNYRFTGFIDLLIRDKVSGEYTVVDHKSSKYPLSKKTNTVLKSSEHSFESYKRQMYLYCCGIEKEYGVFPKFIVWNHFKDQAKVKIEFNYNEYRKAIEWFVNTIKQIEDEKEYNETLDYFYCNNLCEFRNSCEYRLYSEE